MCSRRHSRVHQHQACLGQPTLILPYRYGSGQVEPDSEGFPVELQVGNAEIVGVVRVLEELEQTEGPETRGGGVSLGEHLRDFVGVEVEGVDSRLGAQLGQGGGHQVVVVHILGVVHPLVQHEEVLGVRAGLQHPVAETVGGGRPVANRVGGGQQRLVLVQVYLHVGVLLVLGGQVVHAPRDQLRHGPRTQRRTGDRD